VFLGVVIVSMGAIMFSSWQGAGANIELVLPQILLNAGVSAAVAPIIFGLMGFSKRMIGLPDKPPRE
jgi:hypothetical protein